MRIAGVDGGSEHISYDLLVGADGSNSIVRGALAETVRLFMSTNGHQLSMSFVLQI